MIPLSWSGRSADIGALRTRCIGCWTSPSAKMTAACATGRLRATSLSCARSLSTWAPETGPPNPASAAGARRLPGTTPTCSKSSHAKLMREPCVDADLLLDIGAEHEVELISPIRPDASWQAKAGQGSDISAFRIDWDAQVVIRLPVDQAGVAGLGHQWKFVPGLS